MPDFKELVKNLYATKGRELTEEKLSYIETNYGKGKEEEFVKNFYATIGEELPQEKFDYIRDTYLKKKEDGGIPSRTPSAPVSPSFGTPSVVEASEQLESQSKLTPPRIKGVSVKSPLEGIKGAPPPTTEYGLRPDGTEKGKGYFGELKMKDGSGKVATEVSIGVNIGGKETLIPSLVPTLTEPEKDFILKGGDVLDKKSPMANAIVDKAIAHAEKRIKEGRSPFASAGEKIILDLSKGVPVKPLSGDMPEAAYQNILAKKEYDVKKEFERQKYDNQRYYRLKDKQQAQELGYTNVKDYYKDRETNIIQDNLDDLEQNEVRSYQRFIDAKRKGDDETANKELATYLDLKSKFRAEINSQKEALKAEKEAVKKSAMYQDFSPEQQQSVQESLDKRIANLDLALQPFYDPKAQLTQFVSDNKAEIASVSKPTQNAKEALEQYVNSQYTKVLDMKKSLGFEDGANALEEYAKEFQLRQQGRGDEVDKYYDEQAKLKNATKLLFLNRTPIDESETALGVAAKSFINSFAPKSKTEIQTNQAIANNIKQIVQDANIGSAVAKEQMDFAEEEAKPYAPYSANWFAEPIGGSAAFMLEFIPASIVTEGAFAATKLGRVVNAFENIRKGGKTLQTGAKYFDVLQKTKVGRGLLNAGAGGLKFGVTSKVVSEMFPSQEDEVNFTTGLTGGTSGVLASKLFGAGGGLAAKMMQRVFGNKAIPAARLISSMGDKIKRVTDANKEVVVGELFEEAGESLGQMWQQSDSGQEFMAKVKEQFGDLDNATQFTIQTLVMAIGMGHGTSLGKAYFEQGKDLYNALPRQSRAKVDQVMNEVKKESDVINDKVAEEIKKEEGITEQEIKQANPVMTQEQLDERLDEVEKRKKGELAQYEGNLDETYAVGSDETIGERIERVYETEKEQIKEEYERAKEPIIGRTDVTQEGLGVATETGTQGVTREGVPSEEVDALKDVESTARALEGVDVKDIKLPSGKYIYHYSEKEGLKLDKKKGAWFTQSSSGYPLRKANSIIRMLIDSNSLKLATEKDVFSKGNGSFDKGLEVIKNEGYDGVKTKNYGQNEYLIFDLNKLKSEQQVISEAYHNAKSKPEAQRSASDNELITSVETLLKPKEYATQEIKQPKGVRTEPEGGIKIRQTKTPSVSDSVQRAKESEKEREVRGEKPPTAEPTETEVTQTAQKAGVTPTKAERKAIASAKIDEIANALKDILPKIEGEKLGVGQDEIIDVIAKAVKALVNTGIEIDEAIKQVKARLSEAFDGVEGISDTDIKDRMKVTERLTPKSREEQNQKAQSYGFKNASHALNSVNKETGETYETFESIPDSVLEEVGKEKAKPETPKGKRRFTQQFIKQYPELAEMLSEDIVNYAKMPNNISVDMANAFIEEVGLEEARAAFADMSSGLPSGARMTLGQLVIKKLEEAGRVDEAIDVLEQVTTRATEMGQEIQALSMWAFLTPQGQLRYAQKTVNKAVERRKKQDKSKTDKLKEKLKKANQEAVDETLQDPKVRGLIEKTDSIIPKGLPTPETKKPKKYIVSDDRVALLKKQIKGKLFSGIPTELIELGVAYVERGAYKFSDFSRAMIKEFGNKIKPYLKEVYTKATETLIKEDYDKSNFDSADNIDKQVAQQKANEAVEKVEKAIKAGNKKALAQAIANLQKVAKQNGLWGQYKKYAVSRLKQLTIQNISDDVKKNPPLDEFTKGLVQNIKSMMMEKAEPKEREKIAKRPAIEVIADAFKNPEAYKEVLEETQKEMRKKYKDDVESLEMLDEYFGEFFDKPFSSKLVGTAIKEAMKEMNITISDIVTSHYTVYDATKKSLVDKLVEQAGLSESEASVLAKAIEKEFDKIATEKKQKLLEKILSNKKRKTPEAKSLEQELIRLTNLGAFSDSDVMSKWAEKMGYPKLTQEQVKEIQKLADAVQRAGKGFERFRAIEDLLSYQANLKGVSQLDVAISIWYANILSGFTTQTINTVANLLNSAILYGNAVAQNPKNAKFIASGFIEGFKRGLIEAKETFRTGYSPIRGKVEVPPVLERVKFEGFSKPLEYAKFIGRLMKAADVLVFEALKEMRAYQLAAKQAAKTSALEPSQSIKDKAAEILGKTDYMIEEATETAELWYENKVEEINESNLSKEEKEKALNQAKIDKQRKLYEYLEEQRSPEFQSEVADYAASGTYNKKPDGILGWMASVINQAKDKLNIAAEDATNPFQQAAVNTAKVFANAIVPFTNIIANVANESLNYTPVGIVRRISGTTALTYNKKELTDQQKVDLMTKAVIGNSLMVAIYLLATLPAGDDDEPLIEITANGTGDYRKNYELQADGWMPYSVRIGKKRISYQYTPFMIPLSFIGNIKDYEKYRGEKLTDMAFGNQVAVAFGHTFRTLLDMTALSSLNKFLSASLDPRNENKVEDLLKASEKTATSVVVPNLFTQSAKYIESAFQIPLKETSDQRFGNVLQHIPYVRNKYYDKLNALGEPIMPDTDKFLSTSKDEPIWGLIANKKAFIGKPSIKQMKRIDAETGQERFYTQEEYYNYGAIRGALIKEAIIKDFDKINAMSDKDAQEYIGSIKNEANMIARLAAESGKDEQSRSKIIETTKKSLEKDKAEKAKSEERKKKEEAKMSPQQIKYMNELDAISSKAGKIQYIINLKEKSGTTWYNVKKDIRKVISNDLIKDLKDLEKEGAIPKLGIAIKEKFD